jgi:hypothetical protein
METTMKRGSRVTKEDIVSEVPENDEEDEQE